MEIILIIALAAAVWSLWNRLQRLERRVAELQSSAWAAPSHEPVAEDGLAEPPERPSPAPRPNVPRVAIRQSPSFAEVAAEPEDREVAEPEAVSPAETPDDTFPPFSPPCKARASFDVEDLFGRVLPIWAGGLTLAVAGFFVVRFSIEAGLLTPVVRVVLGFLFGLGLLGGAEAAYRAEHRVADPRVRQALAGAGIATLYAGFYLAGSLYDLIAPGWAFLGLAAVTAAAIGLSHRFGVPSAVLGLVGGFAAPLLVDSQQANVPLLATYLALLTGGLMGSARARRWGWLGVAALGGGLVWSIALLAMGTGSIVDLLAVGGFIVLTGALLPALLAPLEVARRRILDSIAAGVAALQMGFLVMQGGFSPLAWGLLALLGAAFAVLGWRNAALRRVSAFGSLLLPFLLIDWHSPTLAALTVVTAVMALIFAGTPLLLVWRGRHAASDAGQLAAAGLGLFAAFAVQASGIATDPDPMIAAAALLLALFPLAACRRLWPPSGEPMGLAALAFAASASLLLFAGIGVLLPLWSLGLVAAGLMLGWLMLARGRADEGMLTLAWTGAIACVVLTAWFADAAEFARLTGAGAGGDVPFTALRWLAAAALLAALAWTEHRAPPVRVAEAGAAVFAYGAGAQLLPADALAWFAAAGGVAALLLRPPRNAAAAAFGGITLLWAAEPLLAWLIPAALSLGGDPMLATEVPGLRDLALRVLPLLAVSVAALVRRGRPPEHTAPLLALCGAVAIVAGHSLFKQIFAIADLAAFARSGLAERTVWQALLLAIALLAWHGRNRVAWLRPLALGTGAAAMAHWLAYTGLLHNPLWSLQAVGPLPLANLLLPAYAVALAGLLWTRGIGWPARWVRPALDSAVMLLIALLTLSELRQLFSDTFLTATPIGQAESLLQSLAGIVLAVAFLWWGARSGERSWRIGSLAVLLASVGKVFLLDAAELDGFLRIASFAALGFSLIGIGWFYSRQLRR